MICLRSAYEEDERITFGDEPGATIAPSRTQTSPSTNKFSSGSRSACAGGVVTAGAGGTVGRITGAGTTTGASQALDALFDARTGGLGMGLGAAKR